MGVKTICKVSKRINVKNICNLAKGYMSKQKKMVKLVKAWMSI